MTLPRGLIVSCQATEGNPLRGPQHMAAMALAAVAGGAVAVRAEGVDDIRAIRRAVDVPVIGLLKRGRSPEHPYITPDLDAARMVADAGADWVAIDATDRPRGGGPVKEFVPAIRDATGLKILADVATFAEGVASAGAGADAVATTLSGYVGRRASPAGGASAVGGASAAGGAPAAEGASAAGGGASDGPDEPDLELVSFLVGAVSVPVIAEGRYALPAQVADAFARGAHAVVVGTAITNPMAITRRFAAAVPHGS